MKTVLKWIGIVLGAVVGLVVVFAAYVFISTQGRAKKVYDIPMEDISSAGADVSRGEHLVSLYCADCHGADLGGQELVNDPALAVVYTENLTSGEGGAGQTFSDADFERAIRHGLRPDGKSLWIMPAEEFSHFSDEDVAAIIAYLRSVEPVDNVLPEPQAGPMGRLLVALGQIPLFPVELIDHNQPHVVSIEPAVTAEYGEYLAIPCTGCHHPDFAGGPLPGEPPDAVQAANLTPDMATGLGTWTEQDFLNAIQQGIEPDGKPLDTMMPWQAFSTTMSEDELRAIWLFLQSLPPVDTSAEG
jgi:cytochrome c553